LASNDELPQRNANCLSDPSTILLHSVDIVADVITKIERIKWPRTDATKAVRNKNVNTKVDKACDYVHGQFAATAYDEVTGDSHG
jgi:hypothetical protein